MDWIECDYGNDNDEVKETNDDVKNYESYLITYILYTPAIS